MSPEEMALANAMAASGYMGAGGAGGSPPPAMTPELGLPQPQQTVLDLMRSQQQGTPGLPPGMDPSQLGAFAPPPQAEAQGSGMALPPGGDAEMERALAIAGHRPKYQAPDLTRLEQATGNVLSAQRMAGQVNEDAAAQLTTQMGVVEGIQQKRAEHRKAYIARGEERRKRLLYKYADEGEQGQIDKWLATRDDPNSTATQVAEAALHLKEASEPDPNRLFGKNLGTQIAVAFAAAAGTFGAALSGTENYALRTIEAMIDRDLDAQKTKAAGVERDVQMEGEQEQDELSLYDDEVSTQLEKKADMLTAASMLAQSYRDQAASEQTQQGFEQTRVDLLAKASDAANEGAQLSDGRMVQALIEKSRQKSNERAAALKAQAEIAKGPHIPAKYRVDLALRKSGIAKIQQLREKFGTTDWTSIVSQFVPGTDASNYEANRRVIAMTLAKAMYGGSSQAAAEGERIEKSLPRSFTPDAKGTALLNAWLDSAVSDYTAIMEGVMGGANPEDIYTLGEGTPVEE